MLLVDDHINECLIIQQVKLYSSVYIRKNESRTKNLVLVVNDNGILQLFMHGFRQTWCIYLNFLCLVGKDRYLSTDVHISPAVLVSLDHVA
jgi:hypothetical protein